ncbi:MAG: ferric reductase-like transmembrane domain-containing protein [Gammaproteobacteria bacterium]|nr:ferric reductase-like transmembrane domain-containing protein [Gammaproteobacteria bacterium]MDE0455056.1 ferric reductase-like transmembrane domain-containing protein [Gammaproteobacteria bacterium]
MLRRLIDSPYLLWLLLALPGAVIVVRYATGATFYGEVVLATGDLSAKLLIAAMAVTPLTLMFPGRPWVRWLLRRRRYLGVAAFGYAALHTVVYLFRKGTFGLILAEGVEPGLLTGWIALAIFVPLAITSNDAAVRRLRRLWKRLHRWVYVAAVLTFVHWVIEAYDPVPGLIHLAVLAALEGFRLWKTNRGGRRRST